MMTTSFVSAPSGNSLSTATQVSSLTFDECRGHRLQRPDGSFTVANNLALFSIWKADVLSKIGDRPYRVVKKNKAANFTVMVLSEPTSFKLVYERGGKEVETILNNKPRVECYAEMGRLRKFSKRQYESGKLVVKPMG